MAFGEDEAVARFHLRLCRVDIHLLEIEVRQEIRDRKRPARMAGLCLEGFFNDAHTDLAGGHFELFFRLRIHL